MTNESTPTFEAAYARLEEILEKMNSGKQSLEDSLSLYEEANRLIVFCNKRLSQAEQKIETLIKNREGGLSLDSHGAPQTQEFTPSTYSTLKSRD